MVHCDVAHDVDVPPLLCVAFGTGSQDDAAGVVEEDAFDEDGRKKALSSF